MDRRQALDEAAHEVAGGRRAVGVVAAVPYGDLVDLEVANRLDLRRHHALYLLDHEQGRCGLGIPGGARDQFVVPIRLCVEDLLDALRLGLVHREDGIRLTLGDAALALGLGLRSDLDLLLLNSLADDLAGLQPLFLLAVEGALDGCLGLGRGDVRPLLCSGLRLV